MIEEINLKEVIAKTGCAKQERKKMGMEDENEKLKRRVRMEDNR